MATVYEDTGVRAERRTERKVAVGGNVVELIAGAGAVVLPILGLIGVLPMILAALAFIAIGGGMMMEGGAARLDAAPDEREGASFEHVEMVGGMSAEMLGGAATVALGILALVGIASVALMAVAAIVAGGALVLGAGTTARLNSYRMSGSLSETERMILRESVNGAAAADVLAGLAAVVLGIVVLSGAGGPALHRTLVLVAGLVLGGALFLNGTTVGARLATMLRH